MLSGKVVVILKLGSTFSVLHPNAGTSQQTGDGRSCCVSLAWARSALGLIDTVGDTRGLLNSEFVGRTSPQPSWEKRFGKNTSDCCTNTGKLICLGKCKWELRTK